MAEAVDAGGLVVGGLDLLIVVARLGEVPELDVVDGDAADADAALLAEDGDRAFEVGLLGLFLLARLLAQRSPRR